MPSAWIPLMPAQITLISPRTFALTFPYDAEVIARIKRLEKRRWNAEKKRWEIDLRHLGEAMRAVGLSSRELDPKILARYQELKTENSGPLRVRLGPVHARLLGQGAPLAAIDAATSYDVPGAQYSTQYQEKKWDGRRHLFHGATQSFPSGLWPRVREVLEGREVEYLLEDQSAGAEEQPITGEGAGPTQIAGPAQIVGARLRPYQREAIDQALAARRGIIQVATGGGKTVLGAHLIGEIGRPALFFVHTLDLLYQAARVLERELGCEIGLLGDGQAKLRPVTVATVQTAARMYDAAEARAATKPAAQPKRKKKGAGEAEANGDQPGRAERPLEADEATRREINAAIAQAAVVIFDECHHVPADMFYKIAMKTRAASWRYGLSATPWRDDHNDLLLEAALGPKVHVTSCSALIDAGWLVAPRIRMARGAALRVMRGRPQYHEIYQSAIVENQVRNRAIAAQAQAWAAEGRSVLVLVAQVAHGRALQQWLPAPLMHGSLTSEERQRHLKELEQKLQPIMIATTLADEGLDVPTLDGVILGGGGKSQTRAFQRIGRALRPAADKHEALILDFMDDAPYLRDHSRARLELYRQEPRFLIELE